MNELSTATILINTALMVCLIIGGYMAIRSGKHTKSGELQEQAINALKAELEAVQRRIDVVERENTRLHMTINLIKSALVKRGMRVTIDGDMVEITDAHGQSSSYSHIQEVQPPARAIKGRRAPMQQGPGQGQHWSWQEETIADMPQPHAPEREM